MTADPVRAITDAVLYEGYILWPYTRSAMKNQRRFTFGGVYPPAHAAAHPDDSAQMRTEVILRGSREAAVSTTVRFLQVVRRTAARRRGTRFEPVDELIVGDRRYLTWEEAVEREVEVPATTLERLREGRREPIAVAGATSREELGGGALIRGWQALAGEVRVSATAVKPDIWRVCASIANTTPFEPGSRQEALKRSFCSTHTLLRTDGGSFVSLADPPPELSDAARGCRNVGTWPVPVGEPGDRSTILSSPIILEDYPRVAPESPGDLFDGGEIDQLLALSILAMTDEEKAEMAASDPRAREILERTEALTPQQLMALHGTVRELGMAR